jgi:hypothetical protein
MHARTHARFASVHVTCACTPTHTPTQGRGGCGGGGAGFQIGDLELGENVGEEQLLSSYGKMDGMRAVK